MSHQNIILVRGARVIDPANSRDEVADVFVKDGKFVAQLSAEEIKHAEIIEAKGLILSPGFVDLNCRLGEPGRSARETFRTGTLSAASGGFTTVVTMPDTLPISDNVGTIQLIRELCDSHAVVNVLPASTLTKQQEGQSPRTHGFA
jgi:dihydroorotase